MALTYSSRIKFGTKAPDFSLPGVDGKTYSPADFSDKKILVVIFICNHCPYVQARWDEFIQLQKDFLGKGVQFVAINSNDEKNYPEDSFKKMKEYAKLKGQNFPYLRDETQETAKAYGAVCTPDIFVYSEARELQYHGRIDENDLKKAIESLLAGKTPDENQKPSMGCSIKWKTT